MVHRLGIKLKLMMVFIVVTTLVLSTAFMIMVTMNVKESRDNIISVLDVVGSILADRCAASLAFSDVESANSNLRTLSSHKSVVYACIRTNDNQVFSEYSLDLDRVFKCEDYVSEKTHRFENDFVDSFNPVMLEGQPIGSLHIKAGLEEYNNQILNAIKISVLVFIMLMVLAIYAITRITNLITNPITKLKNIAQEVTSNADYSIRMSKRYEDEVGVLVESFNDMLDQIQERDDALIQEKERAEKSALSAKRYAKETELINEDLENEISERARIEEELQKLNETLEEKVEERTKELQEINEKIGEISRSAGMAEVASGVLHNVGNVLNSVNVSASMIREQVRNSKSGNLKRVVEMLESNKDHIGEYITKDEKGSKIPEFLDLLSKQMESEKDDLYKELDELASSIDHIKNVISMQQSYAGSYGVREQVYIPDLVEDALKINMEGMVRNGIDIIKSYENIPLVYLDKHKAMQIVINLISNAKYALIDCPHEKKLYVGVGRENENIRVEVKDTGVGISEEDMPHLFEYGFKKRRGGHGYGLHHSALVANELGGNITVDSEGLGKGACFRLYVPVDQKREAGK